MFRPVPGGPCTLRTLCDTVAWHGDDTGVTCAVAGTDGTAWQCSGADCAGLGAGAGCIRTKPTCMVPGTGPRDSRASPVLARDG